MKVLKIHQPIVIPVRSKKHWGGTLHGIAIDKAGHLFSSAQEKPANNVKM